MAKTKPEKVNPKKGKALAAGGPEKIEAEKQPKQEKSPKEDLLTHILSLGGNKKDLDLIDVADASDVEDLEVVDDDTEPIKRDDILQLIQELGIRKERPDFVKKEKKVKLATSEYVKGQPSTATEGKRSKNKFKVQDEEVSSTTLPEPTDDIVEESQADLSSLLSYITKGYTKRRQLLVKPGRWLAQLERKDHPVHTGRPHTDIAAIETFASRLLSDDTEIANTNVTGADKSNREWVKKMASSGTLADRAAALTTVVQEDVVHNISSLESMVNMVKKKDRRESMAAIGSLKDIFIDLLPNRRRLRTFQQMPIEGLHTAAAGNKDTQDRLLTLWYFESRLKKVYESFVDAVLSATFDTVAAHKLTALKVLLDLLMYKPEQEKKLLSGLVNKLGDPERKVAANTAHLLGLLVRKHPNMKQVVATEVENILYRPNIAQKAQYYAICFLNQMLLSEKDKDLSVKLVTIYFSFFKASIKTNEVDSKLMSALLVGVVRAFPFAKGSDRLDIETQMSAIYKLVHTVNKLHVSLQALSLLYQVCTASDSMTDRYYTSLYAKLLDPELKNSSKQSMFLNLVYKSMKSDPSDRRCKAFIKRLLQMCAYQYPPFICAALITISEVVKSRTSVLSLRITHLEGDDESEDEHFVDADSSEGSDDEEKSAASSAKGQGWTHKTTNITDSYDGLARNPLYCYADKAIETELILLSRHYHPSVVVFAKQLLNSESIVYSGEPMADFSLQKFLDRFVFRNPKKINKQGKAEHALSSRKRSTKAAAAHKMAVNTDDFYKLESESVPADQLFFHSYFHKLTEASKHKLGSKLGEDEGEKVSDDSDVEDDDFDAYLAKYERSLYRDMNEDVFGADFASDFKKRKTKDKSKKSADREESDSDSGLSDEDFDDADAGLDLKPEDFGLTEEDLAGDGDSKAGKRKTKHKQYDSDEDMGSDDSGELPLHMDGSDVGSDDDIEGLFAPAEDFDEENTAFSDDEFSSLDFSGKAKGKKKSKQTSKLSKKPADSSHSLFAAADEFADLLDEESADKRDTISSSAVVNRPKTGAKQIAWEDKQERWLSGKNRKRVHPSTSSHKRSQRAGKSKKRK